MKVAFFVGPFPSLSETFIIDQIVGLLGCGINVDIYASKPKNINKIHPKIIKYNLQYRTNYLLKDVYPLYLRYLNLPKYLIKYYNENNGLIRSSFDFKRFGIKALSLNKFYEAATFFNNKKFDIIHAHFGPIGNNLLWLKEHGAISGKLVTSFHGYDMSAFLKMKGESVYDRLFHHGDLFLPISQFWEKKLIKIGCFPEKTKVHHMGIDCEKFEFSFRSNVKGKIKNILSIGRLTEKKGLQYSISAIAILLKKKKKIIYNIIGDGNLKEKLQRQARSLGIDNQVRFLGWMDQDTVINYLQKADILLAPSVKSDDGDMEGIPVVLMEAMAIGVPVISTNHSGIPELIIDGYNGFTVDERDVSQLTDKIELLVDNYELEKKFALNARQKVKTNFNINRQVKNLVKYYERILD